MEQTNLSNDYQYQRKTPAINAPPISEIITIITNHFITDFLLKNRKFCLPFITDCLDSSIFIELSYELFFNCNSNYKYPAVGVGMAL